MAAELRAPSDGGAAAKYRILKRLAVGGMAEIYLARVTGIEGFEKHVVLKKIRPVHSDDPRFVAMFLDEARLAAMLHHHNIAQVYDIGELDGSYFFSMEFLHGQDCLSVLKRQAEQHKRLPLDHALTIISGAAAGLHYAHDKVDNAGKPLNIVHRDVSPSNILVTYDGAVKLVDFGIARAAQHEGPETRSGTLKGKISYMSPEQCRGEPLDRRSDVFSLGIVLYETTTSSRLFKRGSDSDYVVMQRIVTGEMVPPTVRVTGYPAQLEAVVMRALALDPDDRYQTARDMLVAVEDVAAQLHLPLSTVRLSAFLEESFGRPPEPWHDLDSDNPADGSAEPDRSPSATSGTLIPPSLHVLEELSSIIIDVAGDETSARLADAMACEDTAAGPTAAAKPIRADHPEPVAVSVPARNTSRFLVAGIGVVAVVGAVLAGRSLLAGSSTQEGESTALPAAASPVSPAAASPAASPASPTAPVPSVTPISDAQKPSPTADAGVKRTVSTAKPAARTKQSQRAKRSQARRAAARRRANKSQARKKSTTTKSKDTLIDTTW